MTNYTGPSLSKLLLFCCGFRAVLTLERAFPVSPQADLSMLLHRDRVRHTRVNLRPSSSSRVVDFQLQGSASRGFSRGATTRSGTQIGLQPPDIIDVLHEHWNLRHHFCPLMGYLAFEQNSLSVIPG